MTKWAYRIENMLLEPDMPVDAPRQALDKLGEEGWELAGIVKQQVCIEKLPPIRTALVFYFKRPLGPELR